MAPVSELHVAPPSIPKQKLHGRAFYESIGSPKFVLAPMVDQSEFAWRLLTRSFMTPTTTKSLVAYTPMLHARMFSETPKFRDDHFQPLRGVSLDDKLHETKTSDTPLHLDGNPAFDRPLFTQFCANDPDELLSAARWVAPYCDAVDLNLGCPQGIARKGKYGAFLQEDQDLIYALIHKLHVHLDVPVTAKIRILETKEKTLAYARKVLSAGASILTVHGRQRDQKGHKTGLANWDMIRYLRNELPPETVLFANGNILQRSDIDRCLEHTGADAVMSAEGNLYDPSIFGEAPNVGDEGREYWRGLDGKGGYRVDAILRRYMDIIYKYVLEVEAPSRKPLYIPTDDTEGTSDNTQPAAVSTNEMIESSTVQNDIAQPSDTTPTEITLPESNLKRKEAPESNETATSSKKQKQKQKGPKPKQTGPKPKQTRDPNLVAMQSHIFSLLRSLVKRHHPIRDALSKCRVGDIPSFETVLQMVEAVCAEGIRDYTASNGQSWEDEVANDEMTKKREEAGKEANGGGKLTESSVQVVREVRRPWWVAQPYVRPLPEEALVLGSLKLSKKELREREMESRKGDDESGEQGGKGEVERRVDEGRDEADAAGHVERQVVGDGSGERENVAKQGLVCG